MAAPKKRGLGRGLDALLGGMPPAATSAMSATSAASATSSDPEGELRELPIGQLRPGRYQPRGVMDPDALEELSQSIRAQGLIQPIIVRPIDGGFEIIAGERRWRAAKLAGLTEVPCLVRDVDDRATVAMALIENIQREDLNPLEEATALKRLIDEFDLTHQETADAVGRSRAAVSNLLRLLELPDEIRALVQRGAIEMGHARALLPLAAPMAIALAKQAADEGWSVRQVEHRVQQLASGKLPTPPKKGATKPKPQQADIAALERELSETLGSRVAVLNGRGNKGKLVIHYASLDALDGVLERLRNKA